MMSLYYNLKTLFSNFFYSNGFLLLWIFRVILEGTLNVDNDWARIDYNEVIFFFNNSITRIKVSLIYCLN